MAASIADGTYQIYTYFPKTAESSGHLSYTVFDGKTEVERVLDLSAVEIRGQTSGTWGSLGSYALTNKIKPPAVTISTKGATGTVAANAVLFVPLDDQ